MDTVIENIHEFNSDIAEIMSEYIYESIVLESANGGNKVKELWNRFLIMIKRMYDKFMGFIRSMAKNIKGNVATIEVTLYDELLNNIQNIYYDLKSSIELIGDDAEEIDKFEFKHNFATLKVPDNKVTITIKKAIDLYKGYIERSQKIINDSNKLITSLNPSVLKHVEFEINRIIVNTDMLLALLQNELSTIQSKMDVK